MSCKVSMERYSSREHRGMVLKMSSLDHGRDHGRDHTAHPKTLKIDFFNFVVRYRVRWQLKGIVQENTVGWFLKKSSLDHACGYTLKC